MMAAIPRLTAAQYQRIEADLPANRRDRLVISALLFRETTGRSLRETSEVFGISRARLNEWERELTDALPTIMRKLRLEPATHQMWRNGGQDWRKRRGVYESVMALRVQDFATALRRTARS